LHQLLVRDRRKAAGDVRLDHPPAAPPALINEHLQGRPAVTVPGGTRNYTAGNPPRRPARARSSQQPARSGPGPKGR
jgi:hypothetical protein